MDPLGEGVAGDWGGESEEGMGVGQGGPGDDVRDGEVDI